MVAVAVDRGAKLSRESTMLSFVVAAFQAKGGQARLCEVYNEFRRLLRQAHYPHIEKPDEALRRCVYDHCPTRRGYVGPPVFRVASRGYKVELSEVHFSDVGVADIFAEPAP